MTRYRKRPITVDAHQFRIADNSTHEHVNFSVPEQTVHSNFPLGGHHTNPLHGKWWVYTLEGPLIVSDGDWIITGIEGEHYPCKPIIFEATYEPVQPIP